MCMRVDRRYSGKGQRVYVAYKIFHWYDANPQLYGQFYSFEFRRKYWNVARRPGFHAYKSQREAKREARGSYFASVRKVYLRGLFGVSKTHYTARYLWVN